MKRSIVIVVLTMFGCDFMPSGPESSQDQGSEGTGGLTTVASGGASGGATTASGGSAAAGNGGVAGNGSGGTTVGGAGGMAGADGSGTGGVAGSSAGGRTGTGGSSNSGGVTSTGGALGAGGRIGTGSSVPDAGGDAGVDPREVGSDAAAQVSYSKQITPLLSANCTSCHGGSRPSAGVSLDTYTGVKANASAASSAMQSGIMPPNGRLSAANVQLFQTWVKQGAQNN